MFRINQNHTGSPRNVCTLSSSLLSFLIRTEPKPPASYINKFQISNLPHYMYFVVPKKNNNVAPPQRTPMKSFDLFLRIAYFLSASFEFFKLN